MELYSSLDDDDSTDVNTGFLVISGLMVLPVPKRWRQQCSVVGSKFELCEFQKHFKLWKSPHTSLIAADDDEGGTSKVQRRNKEKRGNTTGQYTITPLAVLESRNGKWWFANEGLSFWILTHLKSEQGLESLGQVMLRVEYGAGATADVQQQQADHERMSFFGVLKTVYMHDVATYEAIFFTAFDCITQL